MTWADPNNQWDGFQFTPYRLDWEKAGSLQLTRPAPGDGRENIPTTVGQVYESLEGHRVQIDIGVEVDGEEFKLGGPSFNQDILQAMLKLRNGGANPYSAEWFYYDHDSSRGSPQEGYRFFVVYENKVILEEVSFTDYSGSGFDPSVFEKTHDPNDSIWMDEPDWEVARTRYWYRRFYTETLMGQMMVLRDDAELYDYEPKRPSGSVDVFRNVSDFFVRFATRSWFWP